MPGSTTNELRINSDYESAINRFIGVCCSSEMKKDHARRRRFIRGQLIEHEQGCLVLRWAAHVFKSGKRDECDDILKKLFSSVLPHCKNAAPMLDARINLIEVLSRTDPSDAALSTTSRDDIRSSIEGRKQSPKGRTLLCSIVSPGDDIF